MACVNNELRVLQDDWDLRATVHQFLHKRDMLRTSSAQPMTTAVPSTAWPDYHGAGRAQDVDISTTGFNWVPPSSSVHTTCAVDNKHVSLARMTATTTKDVAATANAFVRVPTRDFTAGAKRHNLLTLANLRECATTTISSRKLPKSKMSVQRECEPACANRRQLQHSLLYAQSTVQVERFVLELGSDVLLCDTAGAQTDSLFAPTTLSGIDTMSSSALHQCGAGGHQLQIAMPSTGATSDVTSGGTTEDDTASARVSRTRMDKN